MHIFEAEPTFESIEKLLSKFRKLSELGSPETLIIRTEMIPLSFPITSPDPKAAALETLDFALKMMTRAFTAGHTKVEIVQERRT